MQSEWASNHGNYNFPADAERWVQQSQDIVGVIPPEHQELVNGYGIDWYNLNEFSSAKEDGIPPEHVLFLSPHADDLELAAGVTVASHVQQGNNVSELLFTLASTGRHARGFSDTDDTFADVRLAEAILGGRILGIQRVGVLTLPDGQRGFDEWMWSGNDHQLRAVWISVMRAVDPHFVFSPHPNPKVDTHPDHNAVAVAAEWMVNWGTENDFYRGRIPGQTTSFREWWRYTTWAGQENAPITHRVEYTRGDGFDRLKGNALRQFLSQNGKGYASSAAGRDMHHGTMANVGADATAIMAEVFNVVTPTQVVRPTWKGRRV